MRILKYFLGSLVLLGGLVPSACFSAQDATLLIVPREDGVVRLGKDVGNRYPTILLTYLVQPDGTVSFHGWSGSEWVNVTPEAFAEGSFFLQAPASAMIVVATGSESSERLVPSEDWCPAVYRITTTEARPLLHLIGRHYDFKYKDWKWFADNYRLPLDRLNPEDLNIAWYHRTLGDNLKKGAVDGAADLGYLQVLRSPRLDLEDRPVPVVSMSQPVTDPVESDGSNAEQESSVIVENPLTNAVPQAVILAPGDADAAAGPAPENVDQENPGEAQE